jgi:hypothetical protein
MGKDEIALLTQQFVPVVFNSINKSLPDDKKIWKEVFHSWTKGAALPPEGRLPGVNTLFLFTASGQPIKLDSKLRDEPVGHRLKQALAAFASLPETERSPVEARTKPDLSQLRYASGGGRYTGEEPPPGRVVLRAYNRLLARDDQGGYRPARVNWYQFQTMDVDPSGCWCGYEGHPRFKAEGAKVPEPTKDMFWLLEPEWQALVPAGAKKGDKAALPRSATRRLFLYGCHNWWAAETLIQLWGPEALQQAEVAATVTAAEPDRITLHLQGSFQMGQVKPYKATFKGQVAGVLQYDPQKKTFTRFDIVVLGDYQGIFYCQAGKTCGPLPIAFAFELAKQDTPADDVVPIGLTPQKGGKLYLSTSDR